MVAITTPNLGGITLLNQQMREIDAGSLYVVEGVTIYKGTVYIPCVGVVHGEDSVLFVSLGGRKRCLIRQIMRCPTPQSLQGKEDVVLAGERIKRVRVAMESHKHATGPVTLPHCITHPPPIH